MGARIKALRTAVNLTQAQLANVLGVTQSSIAQWESGRTIPETTMLPKIAKTLGCTIDTLFDDIE